VVFLKVEDAVRIVKKNVGVEDVVFHRLNSLLRQVSMRWYHSASRL
jgi:hypothetical protein